MPRFFPTALFIVMISVYFKPVENLKCYVCRSDSSDNCAEITDTSPTLECPVRPDSTVGYCRKIQQQLLFKEEESVTTIRECGYEQSPKQPYRSRWIRAVYQETSECEDDLCNVASFPALPGMLLTLAGVLTILPLYEHLFFR